MILLVIPAHNKEEELPPLLAAVLVASVNWAEPYRAVIVDDGSTDNSADVVQDFCGHGQFELLSHPKQRGEGMALKAGLIQVLERADPADIVITLDADNIHSPALVKEMLLQIQRENDVVIASRFADGGGDVGLSILESLVGRGAAWLMNRLFPVPGVQDHTSHCRAHRAATLQELLSQYGDRVIQESGSACWVEVLLKLARLGPVRFAQVPLAIRHDLKPEQRQRDLWATIRDHAHVINRGWRYR
jgi:dolichol-phosphate mannosyltransferase